MLRVIRARWLASTARAKFVTNMNTAEPYKQYYSFSSCDLARIPLETIQQRIEGYAAESSAAARMQDWRSVCRR